MGSYTFKWEHPANEVFVTGTFDNWTKSVQLEKKDGCFEKTVQLPSADDKIFYKFVVDGSWLTNDSAPSETDEHNNTNNILLPSDIERSAPAQTMSTVTPESTTAQLAGEQPKETTSSEPVQTMSTVAPESTTAALAGQVPEEERPTTSSSVPGAFPETPGTEPTFSVSPIPATAGSGNPVHLEPGEKVPDPSTLTSNTINSTVKLDKESYEKSDALQSRGGPGVSPEAEREAQDGAFGVPPVTGNMIPESSLPMGNGAAVASDPGPTIQSTAPQSTTAQLAGQVPLEPRGVPQVVSDSQKEAGVEPEASASPEAVQEKKEVEEEIKDKVPEQPATAEDSTAATHEEDAGSGAAATVPAQVTGSLQQAHASPEAAANAEAVEEKKEVEDELLKKVSPSEETGAPAPTADATGEPPSVFVPDVVKESIQDSHQSPEAASNPEAVVEKAVVEDELKHKVHPAEEAGEPAPTEAAALSATAPSASATAAPADGSSLSPNAVSDKEQPSSSSWVMVQAAGTPETKPTDDTKPTLPEVPPVEGATSTTEGGLNAPAGQPAQSEVTAASTQPTRSREVSPMSKQPAAVDQTEPTTTTGVATSTTPAKSDAAPGHQSTASSAVERATDGVKNGTSTTDSDKKKKRRSFFGRLKDKLTHHDK